jgi:hypothetical protein
MASQQRVRNNHDELNTHHYYYLHPNTGATVNDGGTFTSFSYLHYMEDTVGVPRVNVKGNRIYPPKAVKSIQFNYRGESSLRPWLADHALLAQPQNVPIPMGVFDVTSILPSISNSLWSTLSEQAFNTLSDAFPPKISGSEFFLGLTKLKELIPSISGDVLRDLSGAFLSKKFGWDNLLSDLRKLSTAFNELSARMKFLKDTYGKPVKAGFYRRDVLPLEGHPFVKNTFFRGQATRLTVVDYQCDYRSGCRITQQLSHIDDLIGWIRAVTGAIGLNNPLKAVWVNLPFSFVVDWFLGVSTHLDRLARVNPAEMWDLGGLTCSMSEKARVRVDVVHEGIDGVPDSEYVAGFINVERFTRRVGLPIGLDVFTISDLSPSQLTLLGAMLKGSSH